MASAKPRLVIVAPSEAAEAESESPQVVLTWEDIVKMEAEDSPQAVLARLRAQRARLQFPITKQAIDPDFARHMQALRARQAEREYQAMMGSAIPGNNTWQNYSFSPEHTGVGASGFQHSVIGLNMVIGVACAYVAAEYLGAQFKLEKMTQTLVSLVSMIFMLVMEMALFIIRAGKFDVMDKQRRLEREANSNKIKMQ